jgi:acetylornithine deacetylase/succinyl-diaminopimelate desuccinylase-like protein
MVTAVVSDHVHAGWSGEHVDALSEFVAVPSLSPAFEPGWERTGALAAAVELVADWFADRHALPGVQTHRLRLEGRTPLLIVDIPAFGPAPGGPARTVLAYGHLDVQPAGGGWTVTDPFRPVLRDSLLYGRGSGDDKYAPLAVAAALEALRAANQAHPHVVLLLEASEESSSVDLPAHLAAHGELLGKPDLILCLDTFVPDNTRLWHSSSMRGIVVADLSVAVAREGMHSGLVGGVVPSSFRLLRALLDRLENSTTGACLLPQLYADVPPEHRDALRRQSETSGSPVAGLPLLPGVRPESPDPFTQLLAQSWEPSIAYVGVEGMPPSSAAGSVLRAATTVRLSIRLPPTVRASDAVDALRTTLETDPPAGSSVRLDVRGAEDGWSASVPPSVRDLLDGAGVAGYAAPAAECGGGATIPPLGILARRFPEAVTIPLGLVTPNSNPHGPDEHIDLLAAERLTVALASLLAAQVRAT